MSKNEKSATKTIDAPADLIYQVIADYENHHPHILPDAYFEGIEVKEGGFGAGTRILVHVLIKSSRQTLQMGVDEPQPGRVITETDLDGGMKTKFALEPLGDQRTAVTITTAWPQASGFQALFNRFFMPGYIGRMLEAELEQLEEYVAGLTVEPPDTLS